MKVKSISFENYKAFHEKQTMQLKPITILIGKNNSGKSSIAKLFTLFENSLQGDIDEPLLLNKCFFIIFLTVTLSKGVDITKFFYMKQMNQCLRWNKFY